jgi:hypothetical protein
MSHTRDGKAVGERGVRSGVHGASAGEVAVGRKKMQAGLSAPASKHALTKNGG